MPRTIASVLSAKGVANPADWPKGVTIGRMDSMRVVGEKESDLERRYYISSRALAAEQLAAAVRVHWGVESRLHRVLDVSFREDASTVAKDNAPQNISMLSKITLTILRAGKTDARKSSLRLKRKGAAWDDGVRERMLGFRQYARRVRRLWVSRTAGYTSGSMTWCSPRTASTWRSGTPAHTAGNGMTCVIKGFLD